MGLKTDYIKFDAHTKAAYCINYIRSAIRFAGRDARDNNSYESHRAVAPLPSKCDVEASGDASRLYIDDYERSQPIDNYSK